MNLRRKEGREEKVKLSANEGGAKLTGEEERERTE